MTVASLFAGIGGFDLAFIRHGHTIVYANEWNRYAADIYDRHFDHPVDRRDITTVGATELPRFDVLCGGFPCQAFSVAGQRRGFDDTRGTLFFDVARICRERRPRYLLLENVKGLLSHDGGETFRIIIATLDDLGYDLQWQVCNSKDFGVPQNRERVFIVGHLRGTARPEVFPLTRDVGEAVFGTLKSVYGNGRTTGSYVAEVDARVRRLTPLECERLQGFPDGWTDGFSDTQRYKCLGNAVTVNVVEEIVHRLKTHQAV